MREFGPAVTAWSSMPGGTWRQNPPYGLIQHHPYPVRSPLMLSALPFQALNCLCARYSMYGYYDNYPSFLPPSEIILRTESGRWRKRSIFSPLYARSHAQAWQGNLSLTLMQRDGYTENHPSSPWDGPTVWREGSQGHTLRPLSHMMPSSMTTSKAGASKLHPCVWFIHYKASIIQAQAPLHTQKCVYIKSSFITSEQHSLCRKFHITL